MNDDPSKGSDPQIKDEQGFSGSSPNPDDIESEDTLEETQDMGLYKNVDEEHPGELNIGEQINSAEEHHTKND